MLSLYNRGEKVKTFKPEECIGKAWISLDGVGIIFASKDLKEVLDFANKNCKDKSITLGSFPAKDSIFVGTAVCA